MEPTISRKVLFGRILSSFIVLFMLADACIDLFYPKLVLAEMMQTGWEMNRAPMLGIISLLCAVLFAIPGSAVLGAILITGFFGGAIATHLRVDSTLTPPVMISIVAGVLTWVGVYCRFPQLSVRLEGSRDADRGVSA